MNVFHRNTQTEIKFNFFLELILSQMVASSFCIFVLFSSVLFWFVEEEGVAGSCFNFWALCIFMCLQIGFQIMHVFQNIAEVSQVKRQVPGTKWMDYELLRFQITWDPFYTNNTLQYQNGWVITSIINCGMYECFQAFQNTIIIHLGVNVFHRNTQAEKNFNFFLELICLKWLHPVFVFLFCFDLFCFDLLRRRAWLGVVSIFEHCVFVCACKLVVRSCTYSKISPKFRERTGWIMNCYGSRLLGTHFTLTIHFNIRMDE